MLDGQPPFQTVLSLKYLFLSITSYNHLISQTDSFVRNMCTIPNWKPYILQGCQLVAPAPEVHFLRVDVLLKVMISNPFVGGWIKQELNFTITLAFHFFPGDHRERKDSRNEGSRHRRRSDQGRRTGGVLRDERATAICVH